MVIFGVCLHKNAKKVVYIHFPLIHKSINIHHFSFLFSVRLWWINGDNVVKLSTFPHKNKFEM